MQSVVNQSSVQRTSANRPQKVQIIRDPSGRITCHGLNPNQQLIKMPDGKLHIITTRTEPNKDVVVRNNTEKVITRAVQNTNLIVTSKGELVRRAPVVIRQQLKNIAQKPTPQRVSLILIVINP